MNHDDIDRILAGEDEILPSSGFAGSVMEAVRREAATPPPIPFPWKRAWPVAAAAVIALIGAPTVLFEAAGRVGASPGDGSVSASSIQALLQTGTNAGAHWLLLAVVLTLVSVMTSRRLAAGKA
jgi:hypothetical protein